MYPEVFKAKNFFKTNDFQNKLYDCVIANYFDLNNPIRFNNFAYSIRELLREKFDYEAPDEQIKLCTWYSPLLENNEEKNKPTRSDKVRYYLAAGLNDSQLQLLQVENDIKSIQNKYLKTVNTLSKYTHINEKNFGIDISDGDKKFREILSLIINFLESVEELRNRVINQINDSVYSDINNHFFENFPPKFDLLSSHTRFSDISNLNLEIFEMTSSQIKINGQADLEIDLQSGTDSEVQRGDGLVWSDSYPVDFTLLVNINDFSDIKYQFEKIDIDNFYEMEE